VPVHRQLSGEKNSAAEQWIGDQTFAGHVFILKYLSTWAIRSEERGRFFEAFTC
jgi:hypothetical protein